MAMSQLSYQQSTSHPQPHSPRLVEYGSAHDDRGCCLHPLPCFSPTVVARYSRITLPIVGPTLRLSSSSSSCCAASSLPRPTAAAAAVCPELSIVYSQWQRYIADHVAALSLRPPLSSAQPAAAFRVSIAATGHDADEKCEHDGLRIALTMPLASLGLDEERRMDFGLAPQESVCCCIDVGRSVSQAGSGAGRLSFHYHVQVFSCKGGSTADQLQDRSSFPLACLLRHRLALLLDDYQPMFPHHPESMQPPPNSFTGCLQPLLDANVDAAAASLLSLSCSAGQQPLPSPRSLLSLAAEALPMNPLLHVMRELQAGLRQAGHHCVICGSALERDATQRTAYCCLSASYDSSCEKALLSSSAFARRLVHGFCSSSDGRLLDLYVGLLTAATQSDAGHFTSTLPPVFNWQPDSRLLGSWHSERFDSITQLLSVLRRIPPLSRMDLRSEQSVARQLDDIHRALLPLLAWMVLYYRCRLHALPEQWLLLPAAAAPCIVAQYAISLHPQLTSRALHRLHSLTAALRFGQQSRDTNAFFFTAPLPVFHSVLRHGPLLSQAQFEELSRHGARGWQHHSDPLVLVDAVLAAAAAAADSSSGSSSAPWTPLPVSQPNSPPFHCVALIERIVAEQAERLRAGQQEQDAGSEDAGEEEAEQRQAAWRGGGPLRSLSPSLLPSRAGRQLQPSRSFTHPQLFWALRALLLIQTDNNGGGGREQEDNDSGRLDVVEDVEDDRENRHRVVGQYGGCSNDSRWQSSSSSSRRISEPD